MTEPLLVIITGPVGGGKSTVALALADHFRATGQMTAVIDLDRVYIMARQIDGYGEASIWAVARRGAAALADSFYADGIQVVIVEGEFFTRDELETLYDALSTPGGTALPPSPSPTRRPSAMWRAIPLVACLAIPNF